MEQVRSEEDREQEEVWEEAAAEWVATVRVPAREEIVCALNAS